MDLPGRPRFQMGVSVFPVLFFPHRNWGWRERCISASVSAFWVNHTRASVSSSREVPFGVAHLNILKSLLGGLQCCMNKGDRII